ncbi:MAG: RHS repeat-associated core domain-containing protein [Bacteroidales bacterium]|nr:RHS repeat-associated core domain-containing protein [Bacteroidales bacterium]
MARGHHNGLIYISLLLSSLAMTGPMTPLSALTAGVVTVTYSSSDGLCGNGYATGQLSLQQYKFTGKELDNALDAHLYDFGARSYDPALMRWTTPDPLMGKYPSLSPYACCANSPANIVDPNGKNHAIAAGYAMGPVVGTLVLIGVTVTFFFIKKKRIRGLPKTLILQDGTGIERENEIVKMKNDA